jgi:hypothetical protein
MSCYRSLDGVEVCGPATAALEFVSCAVEGRVAGGAGVDACGWHVGIVFAGVGGFGAFGAEDAELFCAGALVGELVMEDEGRWKCTFVQDSTPLIIAFLDWERHFCAIAAEKAS